MSDEFDSPDASKKAGVEGTLNNAKRPSDDVVQTAPVKCRYTKSAFAQTSQAFAFAGRPEQEKTDDRDGASVLANVHLDADHNPHSNLKLSASICAFSVAFVLTCRSENRRVSSRL